MHVSDARRLDDAQFESVLVLVQRHDRCVDPTVQPTTGPELRRLIDDDRTEANRHERVAALDDDGTARALGHLELESNASNLHFASAQVLGARTDPAAGRVVLAALLEIAVADGRTTLLGWGPDDPGEAAFWADLGAEHRYQERVSALDLTTVDQTLMTSWIERRSESAADVELIRWKSECPKDHLEAFAACVNALNDAPLEGVELNEWAVDGNDIREDEDANRALGRTGYTILAVSPAGDPVGYTQVLVNEWRPAASWQGGTAVVDAHRRRGVGRWIKAEMWRWLRAERPDVERLFTGNAGSNAGMLGINVAMGYELSRTYAAWQADISTLLAALPQPDKRLR